MPNDLGDNTTENNENEFPNKGNFSASQNNFRNGFNQLNNNTNNQLSNLNTGNNIPNNQNNAKQQIAKKGIETAANAAGGALGGQAAKAAMNSKLGKKALNATSKLGKNPLMNFGLGSLFSKNTSSDAETEEESEYSDEDNSTSSTSAVPNEVTNFIKPIAISGGLGCLGIILSIVVVASVFLAPIFFITDALSSIKEGAENFWNSIIYFFKGCANEAECNQKEQQSFYDKLIEVHDEYKKEYNITLNTELITATLTYFDPVDAMEEAENSDNPFADAVDYKKSEKKIKDLAENMVSEGIVCLDAEGNVIAEYKENEKVENCSSTTKKYYIDDEKYRNYLETSFIKSFYLKGVSDEESKKQVPIIVNEIYSRVEMVKYLNSSDNSSTNMIANNTTVLITDCATGNIVLEEVSLYEYLQGVLYIEGYATNRSEEFLKVQAVIAKNYLYAINGATSDSIPTTLKIKNCQMNQLYCNVEKGCYSLDDGTTPNENDSYDTIVSAPDSFDGKYHRTPITDVATLEKIKRAIDSTLNEFIIKNNRIVTTQYRSDCEALGKVCNTTTNILDQKVANNMIEQGKTYKEVLAYFYDGEITEKAINSIVYPLDIKYNEVTSAYGWRVHPIKGYCRTHGGTDIAAPADANIYSISDGVVVDNYYSSSYGNVTIIGHGSTGNGNYKYYSLYAHQIRLSKHINKGEQVKAGQVIGNVGSTGDSTGNHLHIEIYSLQNGNKVKQDPVTYFKGIELTGMVNGALYNSCTICVQSSGTNNVCN